MRPTLYILMLISLPLTILAQQSRPKDPKALAEAVFKSFKAENHAEFEKYFIVESDCDTMIKNVNEPDSLKLEVLTRMKMFANKAKKNSKNHFDLVLTSGKQKGVDWQNTILRDVKFEIKNHNGILISDVYLVCRSGHVDFTIMLDNCRKSDAWLMMDKVVFTLIK